MIFSTIKKVILTPVFSSTYTRKFAATTGLAGLTGLIGLRGWQAYFLIPFETAEVDLPTILIKLLKPLKPFEPLLLKHLNACKKIHRFLT
jgi:hypothetical protein